MMKKKFLCFGDVDETKREPDSSILQFDLVDDIMGNGSLRLCKASGSDTIVD